MNLKAKIAVLTMVMAISAYAGAEFRIKKIEDIKLHALKINSELPDNERLPANELRHAKILEVSRTDKRFDTLLSERLAQKWIKLGEFLSPHEEGRGSLEAYWNGAKKEIVVFEK